jgi:5'-3' exonuclease
LEYVYFSETKKKKKQRYKIKKETSDEDQLKHDSDSSLYTCFDSYNTLAGTPFMNKLEDFLIHYITSKLEFDLTWKNLNVIFSGSKIPGEGRHKILSFLRQLSTLKDSPAVRRCVYTHQENSFLTCLMAPIQNLFLLKNIVTKDQCIENQKINFNVGIISSTLLLL